MKNERGLTVYIVLTPVYEGGLSLRHKRMPSKPYPKLLHPFSRLGFPNDRSIQAYQQVADEVFFIAEIGADSFLNTVETFEESNCL